MRCGRCGGALHPETVGEAQAFICGDCGGMLMKQAALNPVLKTLAEAFASDMAYDTELPKTDPPTHEVSCRVCGQPMNTFGYMETRNCYAHRCARDWEVWIDQEQLSAMLMLYARTNFRRQARESALEEELEGMSRRTRAQLSARLKSNTGAALGIGIIG